MTAQITPDLIKKLRDRTGIAIGKCKEALSEAHGDIELAISNLRKAGMAAAVKKEGREANEGIVVAAEGKEAVAVVEVNAETDFVVQNERFQKFAKDVAEEVALTKPESLEAFLSQTFSKDKTLTIDELRATIVQAIGENIQISRLKIFPKNSGKSVGIYSHLGGKILCVVEIEGTQGEEALAKDIGMHIAAASPEFIAPENVPESVINHEKDIAAGQVKGKPEAIVAKIVEGKLNAYYDTACLLRQKYIKDDSQTVGEVVESRQKSIGQPLKVTNFIRWSIGE
jgi:elongation factor Ts